MSSRLNSNVVDAAALADELVRYRIVEADRMTELLAGFRGGNPVALAEFLGTRGVLTPFQADRALAGDARSVALGPYRLMAPDGLGTFGPVAVATHKDRVGSIYRVRVFPLRSLWRARQAKQYIRSLAVSPHMLIVPPIDADSANGFHYLVWAHAQGQSLADRVAKAGPLSPGEAAGLLAHLAEALHACHVRNVIHGALTPGCVLIAPDGLPRLLELGAGGVLAANLSEEESLLDTLSSAVAAGDVLEYAAPEFAVDPTPTFLADQYALGAIGYFALSGQAPFPVSSLAHRITAKQSLVPRPLTDLNPAVPADLAAILEQMLLPSPSDRFSGLDEVHGRLADVASQSSFANTLQTISVPEPVVEALPFSGLRGSVRGIGRPDWELTRSPATQFPPSRDGSEACIDFNLPELVAEEIPEPAPTVYTAPPDTPNRITSETQASAMPARPDRGSRTPPVSPAPAKPPVTPDPRKNVGAPVHYHTEASEESGAIAGMQRSPAEPWQADATESPAAESILWKKVKRNVLFWKAPKDAIQVSVFGSPAVAPGRATPLTVYLHTRDATESVRTLSRAFHHDSELIATGTLSKSISRDTELAIHLSVANAGVSKSQFLFRWRGQPERLVFELHVPWEAPSGAAPGLISLGCGDVRIGKVEFRLNILPRKG